MILRNSDYAGRLLHPIHLVGVDAQRPKVVHHVNADEHSPCDSDRALVQKTVPFTAPPRVMAREHPPGTAPVLPNPMLLAVQDFPPLAIWTTIC